MNDIEALVRESLRYDGGSAPLSTEPLVRRARRRRLAHRATTAVGAVGIAAAVSWMAWPQQHAQVAVVEPAAPPVRPSTVDKPSAPIPPGADDSKVTALKATERITTPAGAVIDVSPERLCVGNTHQKPDCLQGANPDLDDSLSAFGWETSSTQSFVYAWLAPANTTQATLQVGEAPAVQAALYRVEGRDLLIAVITGHPCWTAGEVATQLATDASGAVVYEHSSTDATCG